MGNMKLHIFGYFIIATLLARVQIGTTTKNKFVH
jgi:hypothetical protein